MANELQEENIHFNSPPCIFYGNVFCAKATIVKREQVKNCKILLGKLSFMLMCYTVKTIFQTSGTVKYLSQSNWTQTHFCRIGILYNLSYARISVRYQNYKSNTLIEFAFAHLDLSPMIITIFSDDLWQRFFSTF